MQELDPKAPGAAAASADTESHEQLVFVGLEAYEQGGVSGLAAFLAAHPTQRGRLERSLEKLRAAGLLGDGVTNASLAGPLPERLDDFLLLERRGQGGMGVVMRARQESLGREVALKILPPDQLFFPQARQRFRREVEAVARLQHPGIVQIHTVGEAQGLAYFAMEYLDGANLGEVLESLAGRRPEELSGADLLAAVCGNGPPGPGVAEGGDLFRGNWFGVVLEITRRVAEAVEHAHLRGVLHRDIKPSNIVVTRQGRVVLLDFGLASLTGADRLTRSGSYLGSLPYMAPELLRGEGTELGARADVYSIGVTLYELLTLEQPFLNRASAEQTRGRVLEGRPRAPRSVAPGLGRDAETVCLVAMDLDPARRYASAADLAEDLGNAVAGRPIRAQRPGAMALLVRAARRRPALAGLVALGLVVLIGGPLLFGLLERRRALEIGALNVELSAALVESDAQRAAAEQNLATAFDAVDRMLVHLGSQALRNVPQMQALRQEILTEALEFYEELVERGPIDAFRAEHLHALRLGLALVLQTLGRYAEAEGVLAQVLGELDRGDLGAGGTRLQQARLGQALRLRSETLRGLGRLEEALRSAQDGTLVLEQAMEHARQAGSERDVALFEENLMRELVQLGRLQHEVGQLAEAEASLTRALELQRRALPRTQKPVVVQLAMGVALDYLALSQGARGDFEAALASRREALAVLELAFEQEPENPDVLLQLFSTAGNLGDQLGEMGQNEEGLPFVERAVAIGQRLTEAFPLAPRFRANLAVAQQQLAVALASDGRSEQARELLSSGIQQLEPLAERFPEQPEYQGYLATLRLNRAILDHQQGDTEAALETLPVVRAGFHRALELSPRQPDLLRGLWQASDVEARLYAQRGRLAEASAVALDMPRPPTAQLALRHASFLDTLAMAWDADLPERDTLIDGAIELLEGLARAGRLTASLLEGPQTWRACRSDPRFEALRAALAGD